MANIMHYELLVLAKGNDEYELVGCLRDPSPEMDDNFIYAFADAKSPSVNAVKIDAINAFKVVAIYEK